MPSARKETPVAFRFSPAFLKAMGSAAVRLGYGSVQSLIVSAINDAVDGRLKPGRNESQSHTGGTKSPTVYRFPTPWLSFVKEYAMAAGFPSFTAFTVQALEHAATARLKALKK